MRWAAWLLVSVAAWGETRSAACAPCHAAIYASYQKTGMARSSGLVGEGLETFDRASFAGYRVLPSFEVRFPRGSFFMRWFIGSGAVGRSYAGDVDGFLFQSPVSYYSARGQWGLSPGYSTKSFVDVARPIERPCLQCHASGVNLEAGTENKYGNPPFAEGGVSCEKCHGPGEEHAARRGPIVNPAKLPPARRDSVCQQCHLTGAARIAQAGRGPETFRAGDLLAEHVMVFVWSRADGAERAATDHAEQLERSKCRLAAGDKLWCGTCHNAHTGETRPSCGNCHAPHKDRSQDCTGCHMPKGRSREGEHVVYTDHTIARRPGEKAAGPRTLRVFRGMEPAERVWALAERRLPLLEKLAARDDADAAVLVQLAQLYDAQGKGAALYERALRLEPAHATAAANLGIYRMREGRGREALALWAKVFATHPGMLAVGLNLTMGQMQLGDTAGAMATLRRVLRFHPDSAQARELLAKLR